MRVHRHVRAAQPACGTAESTPSPTPSQHIPDPVLCAGRFDAALAMRHSLLAPVVGGQMGFSRGTAVMSASAHAGPAAEAAAAGKVMLPASPVSVRQVRRDQSLKPEHQHATPQQETPAAKRDASRHAHRLHAGASVSPSTSVSSHAGRPAGRSFLSLMGHQAHCMVQQGQVSWCRSLTPAGACHAAYTPLHASSCPCCRLCRCCALLVGMHHCHLLLLANFSF